MKLKLISVIFLLCFSFVKSPLKVSAQSPVECYEADGEGCIYAGLFDNCDADYLYESNQECEQSLPCPAETSNEFANATECNARCYTNDGEQGSCEGPNNRCCILPNPGEDLGEGMATVPITKETLDALNPIKQFSEHPNKLSTPGSIISYFLADFAFYLAGLILFIMLVWGGFEMMMGAADKKSLDAGKQRVTAALIGFLILFAVFWLARILELMFGIEILFS